MNNVIEATMGNGSLATPSEGDERMLLLFARYWGHEDLRAHAQEEAAVDAEDTLTQADEALVLG